MSIFGAMLVGYSDLLPAWLHAACHPAASRALERYPVARGVAGEVVDAEFVPVQTVPAGQGVRYEVLARFPLAE